MFGFGKNRKNRRNVYLVDCTDASIREISKFPAVLGGGKGAVETDSPFLEISKSKNGNALLAPVGGEVTGSSI